MRTDALIIEGPEGFDPTTEEYGYSPICRQIKTMMLAKPYRVLVAGDKSMAPIVKTCTRLGADFFYPSVFAYDRLDEPDSFFCGLKYLQNKCDRILIAPASYPFIDTETYRAVMDTVAEIAVASHNGKRGWPVLISTSLIPELVQLGGLGALLDAYAGALSVVDTGDVGVITDVCAEGFSVELGNKLAENHSLHKIHPSINLAISRENAFYGRGIAQIFRLIDETEVLTEVWRMMGMASSHGWKIINRMQDEMTALFFKSSRGRTAKSEVTEAGKQYAADFAEWFDESEAYLRQSFEERFAKFNDK